MARLSLKDLFQKWDIEFNFSSEEREIELTRQSMELSHKRTQKLEKLIQESGYTPYPF